MGGIGYSGDWAYVRYYIRTLCVLCAVLYMYQVSLVPRLSCMGTRACIETRMCNWGILYLLCSAYRGLWGLVVVQLMCLSSREHTGSSSWRCPGFGSQQLPHNALHKCIVGCQCQQGAMKIIANYTDTEIFNLSKIVKLMMVNKALKLVPDLSCMLS